MMRIDDIRNWVIYKITSPSGRVYIGKSCNIEKRLTVYKVAACKQQPILCKSLLKYGFSNHEFVIIDSFISYNDYASEREKYWIGNYKSNFSKFPQKLGMNLTEGGDGLSGYVASEETRKKQSLKKIGITAHNKGVPRTAKQIEILRAANIGRIPWNKGKKFNGTDEERKIKFGSYNIGNTYNTGRKHSAEIIAAMVAQKIGKPLIKKWKPILKYDKNNNFLEEYPSIMSAATLTGISRHSITHVLKEKKDFVKGFVFKYK